MQQPREGTNPLQTFHLMVALYILMLSAASISNVEFVKTAANGLAIGLFAVIAVNWLFFPTKGKIYHQIALALGLFYIGMLGSSFFSPSDSNAVETLKISLPPAFLAFGMAFAPQSPRWTMQRPGPRFLMLVMVLAPLFVLLVQILQGQTNFGKGEEVSIFANRNNAGLYAVALLAYYFVVRGKAFRSPIPYLVVGLMFGTMGLLLAIIGSIALCHGRFKPLAFTTLASVVALVGISAFPELSRTLRIQPIVDSVLLLLSGKVNLGTVSYGELVQRLNTSDLSFLFRLKHWYNLLSIYADGTALNWIFGFGTGASISLSDIHLVPHNDYLRVFFEYGIFSFMGFSLMIVTIMRGIQRGWSLVPFLAIIFYFFSENLINNYMAMILFFFSAGIMLSNTPSPRFQGSK